MKRNIASLARSCGNGHTDNFIKNRIEPCRLGIKSHFAGIGNFLNPASECGLIGN